MHTTITSPTLNSVMWSLNNQFEQELEVSQELKKHLCHHQNPLLNKRRYEEEQRKSKASCKSRVVVALLERKLTPMTMNNTYANAHQNLFFSHISQNFHLLIFYYAWLIRYTTSELIQFDEKTADYQLRYRINKLNFLTHSHWLAFYYFARFTNAITVFCYSLYIVQIDILQNYILINPRGFNLHKDFNYDFPGM